MRRDRRSPVLLFAVASLIAASCSGGGAETTSPGESLADAAVGSAESVPPVDVSTTHEPDIVVSTPTTEAAGEPDPTDLISVVDSDPAALAVSGTTLVQTDRIVVMLAPDSARAVAEEVAAALGGEIIGELSYLDLYQVSVPGGDEASVRAAVDRAGQVPGVEVAYTDTLVTFDEEIWGDRTSPLSDPVYEGDAGGGYRAIGLERAWQYVEGSGIEPWGVHVGITDTRLWTGSDEFDNSKITSLDPASDERATPDVWKGTNGWQGEFPEPDGSHGTAVATIIAGDADDGGALGVASVLGDRMELTYSNVLDENIDAFVAANPDAADLTKYRDGSGRTWSVKGLQGLLQQVQAGAKVINMSWGCYNCDTASTAAYRRFFTRMAADHPDVVFVAAAGNDNAEPDGTKTYPGGMPLPNVITVGNVNNDGTTNESSNRTSPNFEVTIAAPGNEAVRGVDSSGQIVDDNTVIGTATRVVNGNRQESDVRFGGGTSMAAPQVTAAIALMKSLDPTLTAAEIKQILTDTARPGVPADPDASTYLPTPVDPKLGAGLLAVDEAVLAVVNRVRKANGLDPIVGTELVQFAVLDAVAITGEPGEYTVRAIVTGCRGECTSVSISVSGDHALGGSTTQHLDAPGDVTWSLTITGDYPVTVFAQRLDNGAGSRIVLDRPPIAGTWSGVFTLTDITIPAGEELPDGSISDGSAISGDALESCLTEAGAAIGEAVDDAIEAWESGFPLTVVFTGDYEQPGSATIIIDDSEVTTPWSMSGSSVVFEFVEDGSVAAFSGTVSGQTMTGAWGSIQTDGTELRGTFTLTRVGD